MQSSARILAEYPARVCTTRIEIPEEACIPNFPRASGLLLAVLRVEDALDDYFAHDFCVTVCVDGGEWAFFCDGEHFGLGYVAVDG